MYTPSEIKKRLSEKVAEILKESFMIFEDDPINEIAMKRVVRKGKIIRKVKVKRKGYKVLRQGNKVKFARMTQKEKRSRRRAARKAWRSGKGARKSKSRRTMIRSKVRMKQLYGK